MTESAVKETTAGIRLILYVASFLVLAVGLSLYLLTARTDVFFSWTINPPLTSNAANRPPRKLSFSTSSTCRPC